MRDFVYSAPPMRVAFGAGRLAALADELDHMELRRVLVLSTPEQRELAERVAGLLGDRAAGVHAEARMHVPVEVADRAVKVAAARGADGCVAVGGGSTVGLGKIIALRSGLPIVAVPTTYAGSEMTPVWGLTENGIKKTGKNPVVLPRGVVYDPELTLSLPVPMSVTSGVNAIAHAVEALYAPDASPIVSLMAEESVRAMAAALPRVVADPGDGRSDALYAAWLAGACLGQTTMGLHHKLCHVLGGTLDLPHSETHTVMLPHVLAFNAPAAPAAADAVARALGCEPLWDRLRTLGAPSSLSALGARREDLAGVVDQAVDAPYSNPRQVDRAALTALLDAAYDGRPPREEPHA
ncbi:maleylacetate reductase [Prauserella cavernicola]|uniref:Maleylacetate reductase n=1 Tax=Prauserella cavernicola TaxID=2800127 RepID=A0A934QVA2_9PSEU|nr:maleylacetate reductase [Prauserella cavernicola]MBK1787170.1 maleylacetate reductase [Prauserella cavernicola]